ncbi:MAG: hypothetical protein IJ705_01485, partial [Oscillospiraceae bacterium]|nr:hypothetical protein [Oscillospiraceae bacterium]
MVRGTSRRVIVVNSPDTDLFEQAIFLVRADAAVPGGVSAQRLVDEACSVARSCALSDVPSLPRRSPAEPLLWASLGAGVIALAWL